MSNTLTKDEFKILFGSQLEMLRIKKDLSFRALAQRCDIDHSDISKIEKGQINIQIGTVMELARGLNVHPKELFDFKFDLDQE
ncbi:helix-turn-helix domain-containing protein [Flavobacterium sp.]|uniref:helix-turn-helix domain-containing protein n=1 Tax=Flavobacterium sp. TaxID=239 RepID=UPI00391A522E